MTSGEPFYFDRNVFDSDDPHAYEEQKPEKPEFTLTELEAAKAQAFEEGKRAGIKENEASLTQSVLGVVQKIDREMNVLRAAEQERADVFETECLHLTHTIISRLFPLMEENFGQDELQRSILNALSSHGSIEAATLEVHADLAQPLKGFLEQQNSGKTIALRSNGSLSLHEFKLEWPSGGLVVNRLDMVDEILDVMKETLAERGVNVHDEVEKQQDAPAPEGESENE